MERVHARVYDVWVLTIYCKQMTNTHVLENVLSWTEEENDDNSVRIASILAKRKGEKVK
jgi:hypothetical protein